MFQKANAFFRSVEVNLEWRNCAGVSEDGAPSMLGRVNGFAVLSQKENSIIQVTHCMVHRQVLVAKELEPELEEAMNVVITMINFVKCNALNTRLFCEHCEDADSDDSKVLFYSDVRWLSRKNVLN